MRQWLTNSRLSPTFSSRSKAAYTDTSFNLKSFLHIYHICHRNGYSSKLGLFDPWPYLVHFVVQFLRSAMQSLHGLSYFSCRVMNRCNSGRDVFSVAVFYLLPYLMFVYRFDVCLFVWRLCAGPIYVCCHVLFVALSFMFMCGPHIVTRTASCCWQKPKMNNTLNL